MRRIFQLLVVILVPILPFIANGQAPPTENAFPGVAIWKGTVYLIDGETNTILVKGPNDAKFRPAEFAIPQVAPRGLAVDDSFVYFAAPREHQVFRVDKISKRVTELLPPNSPTIPVDIAIIPDFLETPGELTRVSTIAILDESTHSVVTLNLSRGNKLIRLGKRRFPFPISISVSEDQILVSDYDLRVYEKSGVKEWRDIIRDPFEYSEGGPGLLFEDIYHQKAKSAVRFRNFIYFVNDKHQLYAFLPSNNRLVPLTYRNSEPTSPNRVIANEDEDELLLAGASVKDFRTWPLIVPIAVELAPGFDPSAPIADLCSYLWKKGFLPDHLEYVNYRTSRCKGPECILEQVGNKYNLVPKPNAVMQQLLCEMNPQACGENKWKELKVGENINVPTVPFEWYLAPESVVFDGKKTLRYYLQPLVSFRPYLRTNDYESLISYIVILNPDYKFGLDPDAVPEKGTTLTLPLPQRRYYFSVAKSELSSHDSGLVDLLRRYPSLAIKPYGMTSQSSAQNSPQQVSTTHNPATLAGVQKNILDHIGFDPAHSSRYGRGNGVPVLVDETAIDCQHPVFFGHEKEDHAFSLRPSCVSPESVAGSSYVDWEEKTDLRHGTCVASVIGGRAGPPGMHMGLAPGAKLTQIDSVSVGIESLLGFYNKEKRPFIVNVSSGETPGDWENAWRILLDQGFVKEGVLFVAAADNDGSLLSAVRKMPATLARDFQNVISVGALNKTGTEVWRDSNTGVAVEILAPGEGVPCAMEVAAYTDAHGKASTKAVYTDAPGTSFATPIVTAVAALLLEKGFSPAEVKARILATADPIPKEDPINHQPLALFGTLNIDNALSDPNSSHIQFVQEDGKLMRFDADILKGSTLKYSNPRDRVPIARSVETDDVLSIRAQGNNLYRLVWFESVERKVLLIDRVLLDGCLRLGSQQTLDEYVLKFGAGSCPDAGRSEDQSKIISFMDPRQCSPSDASQGRCFQLIAPRLGAERFKN